MISISQTVQYIDNKACVISTYYGLSTDTPKPTDGVGNGSAFIEMDTSKVYFFDVDSSTWLEWGAESNAASSLSMTRPSLTLGNALPPDVVENMPDTAEEEMPDTAEEEMPDTAEEEMPEDAEAAPNAADTTEDGEGE